MKSAMPLVVTLVGLSCCICFLSRAAQPGPQPAPDGIAKLIAQLDDEDFDKREEAMARLEAIGERLIPDLRKALENKEVSPESGHRMRYLLGILSGPAHGLVWRGLIKAGFDPDEKPVAPEGIQLGDVITQIDGQAVDSVAAQGRARWRMYENTPVTIWRQGKTLQLNLTMNAETTLCFRAWPDPIRIYEQFGHRGKWDETVMKALAVGTIYSNSQCEPLYQQAYDAGCRDAMVIYFWGEHLARLGKLEEAEKIVSAALAEKLVSHPGGKFLYAELPVLHAGIFRFQGKFGEAGKIVAKAEAEAQRNGAFQAIKALKYHLLRNVRYDDKPDPLAFLKGAKGFPYELLQPKDLATWCQFVTGDGEPARALELLAFLKPKLHWEGEAAGQLDEMVKYYESQNELAKTFKSSPAAKRKQVPVMLEGGVLTCLAPSGTYVIIPGMPGFKTPGGIELYSMFLEFPKNFGVWAPYFRFGCKNPAGPDRLETSMSINRTGAFSFGQHLEGEPAYPDKLFTGMEWGEIFRDKRIRIWVEEGRTQWFVGNRAFRTYYYKGKPPEELLTYMSYSSTLAWFHDFMYYAPTDADVDVKAIQAAWDAWQAAGMEGERAKIESSGGKLLAALKPIPEAKRGIAQVEAVLRNFKAFCQPGGWRVDARAVLDDPQTVAMGLWEASGDWLVGLSRPDRKPPEKLFCQIPLLLPKDFELTGQVAAEGNLCPDIAFMLLWNSNLMRSPPSSLPTKPLVLVPWTKPPFMMGGMRTPAQRKAAEDFVNRVQKERTFSFCLRVVQRKVAMFVNGVEGPLLNDEYTKDAGLGSYLCLHQNCPHGLFMIRGLKLRPLDPGADLNAPVQLPELKPIPAKPELKALYDRAEKIKVGMQQAENTGEHGGLDH